MHTNAVEKYTVSVPQNALNDLRDRLARTRLPEGVTDSGGLPLHDLAEVLRIWRDGFDWRAAEARIDEFPHFRVAVDGVGVHVIDEPGPDPDALPLLLLHGWPGSFVEMLGIARRLSQSFPVVVPSLPGFGFSDIPGSGGMSNERMADTLCDVMTALGHPRFIVHGGDVGASVATWMARKHPDRVAAIHLNYIPGSFAPDAGDTATDEEMRFLRGRDEWLSESGAYAHIQRTRPLTVAYALSDSPAGLAAWILEKFREWADPSSAIPVDEILTNLMIYWVTNTITSSMRYYLESARTPLTFRRGERLHVPCGIAHFPLEAPFPPRSWVERVYDVRRWSEMPRGGHFAAMEAPDLLASDIEAFLK